MAIIMRQALKDCSEATSIHESDDNTQDSWHKTFHLEASFIAFLGHFPDHPVLPAIVQILMAQITVEEATGEANVMQELIQAKFIMPIIPNMEVKCIVTPIGPKKWQAIINADGKNAAFFRWRSQ